MNLAKLPLIALVLACLIAFGGCGGSSDSTSSDSTSSSTESSTSADSSTDTTAASGDYSQELGSILTDFGTSFQSTGADLQGVTDPDELTSGINSLQDETQSTLDELNALDPPSEAQEGQDQLVSAFDDLQGSLGDISEIDPSNPQGAQDVASQFQDAASQFQTDFGAAIDTLSAAGVGPAAGAGG